VSNSPEEWLQLFLKAEDAALARSVERRSFLLMPRGGMQWSMEHPGWDNDWPLPTEHDIDDLAELDWVRPVDYDPSKKQRQFTVSLRGKMHGLQMSRASAMAATVPVSMEWSEAEPVLSAAVTAFEQAGAPEGGIHVQSFAAPGAERAAISELARVGLLIDSGGGGDDQHPGPSFVQPSLDAYQLTRGWPSSAADAAIDRLVQVLLESAERTDDPDERSRIQGVVAWLGRFGSGVIQGTASGVTTALLMHSGGGHQSS
jgi:hypothetical protein